MQKDDTIELLNECDSGVKNAINSIDELTEHATSEELKKIFVQYRHDHEELGKRIQTMLETRREAGKDPGAMVKAMSWVKINAKMLQSPSDHTVADLMMDGCNMGIKSLCKYQNKYLAADESAKIIAKDLVDLEQKLMIELRAYL